MKAVQRRWSDGRRSGEQKGESQLAAQTLAVNERERTSGSSTKTSPTRFGGRGSSTSPAAGEAGNDDELASGEE